MARPRTRTRDVRQAVFDAAAAEFALHGFEAAGVDRIAARARVNKATIYYYFGSKRDLYVEVLRQMFRAVGARARAIADSPTPADRKTDAWIAAVVEEAAARPWFPPIMLRELGSGAPNLDRETVAMLDAVYQAVRDILTQGQQEGLFRAVDPLLTHLTIMPAILIFFARQRALREGTRGAGLGEPRTQEEFVRHMQESVRRMLENRP